MFNPARHRMFKRTPPRLSGRTMNTANLPDSRTTNDSLTALICHDTSEARQEAMTLLQRVVNRVDDGFALGVRSWCWDDLEDQEPASPRRAQALSDARHATLCVIAWSGQQGPTAGLRRVVDEWTHRHQEGPAMLAVLRLGQPHGWQLLSPAGLADLAGEDPLGLLAAGEDAPASEAEQVAQA